MVLRNELLELERTRDAGLEEQLDFLSRFLLPLPAITGTQRSRFGNARSQPRIEDGIRQRLRRCGVRQRGQHQNDFDRHGLSNNGIHARIIVPSAAVHPPIGAPHSSVAPGAR
jgi:hypothetical protein